MENYGRIMGDAAQAAMMPYNALQDARNQQKRNTLLDLQAQRMQGDFDDDAEWDAAIQAGDWDTAMRIDPQVTPILIERERQKAMTGLEEIPVTRQPIDMKPLQAQENWAAERSRLQGNEDRNYRLDAAREYRLSTEPDSPQKAPEGYRWTGDGSLEAIPGGPKDQVAVQPLSPKDTNTARVKLNQVKIARAALKRVQDNWGKIQGGMTAGPGQGYIPSEGGKAFDAAVNAMRGSITALTRVPGVGAMSDYETRLDQSKFPDRASYESVTADQIQGLADLLDNVESGYQEMLGGKPAGGESRKGAPSKAIEYLKANPTPAMKAAFRAKYGYVPDGI
jgi:hypothetical protein